ncbi:HTH domain-containing protein [Lacticaseibacillus rhamnosus]|uniref:HTH domain-containing protein n=1 Tax=Lacticaseibacillus rhamnosus TaxID=47715 RepID=UPI001CDA1470|nr:HTH domain-containing protein [Lacticaseibacillus rhamnosus]
MNKRQADLFNYLCGKKDYIPAKVLAQQYNVSSKTIYKDLAVLAGAITGSGVQIRKKPRVGIKVNGHDQAKVKAMATLKEMQQEQPGVIGISPAQRRASIVKAIILQNKQQTLKELSDHWLVSKASILNDIAAINDTIAIDNSGIESTGYDLQFNGNEEQRQTAMTTFVVTGADEKRLSSSQYLEQFFEPNVVKVLRSCLRSLLTSKQDPYKGHSNHDFTGI